MNIRAQVASVGDDGFLLLKLYGGDMSNIKLNQIVDVNIRQRQRSINQHNFYHLFVEFCLPYYQMFDPTMTHDSLHMYFRSEVLGYNIELNGEIKRIAKSTTQLGVAEFCEFIENCFIKAIDDVGCPIGAFQQEYEDFKKENNI